MNQVGIPNLDKQLEASLITDMKKVEDLMRSHIKGDYPLVVETSRHLVEAGGKRLRPLLTLISAQFGDPSNYDIIKAAVCCELQAKTFERLVIGQIKETQGKSEGLSQIDHYMKVVADKTGSLIATSARFGALLSGASPTVVETLTKFGEKIGVAFQVADDLLDIASNETASGKTPGTDLKEGIPTLVTLFVMADNDPADKELILKLNKPISDEDLPNVILELRKHKALKKVQDYLSQVATEANDLLIDLPAGAAKEALNNLTFALVNRST